MKVKRHILSVLLTVKVIVLVRSGSWMEPTEKTLDRVIRNSKWTLKEGIYSTGFNLQSPNSFTNASQNFLWPSMTYCVYQVVSWGRGCPWPSFTSVQQHQHHNSAPGDKKLPHLTAEPPKRVFGWELGAIVTLWGHTDIKHVSQTRHIIVMSLKLS